MPRIIVVHPSPLYRAGVVSLLSKTSFKSILEVSGPEELNAQNAVIGDAPDVRIAFLHADQDTVHSIQQIRVRLPDTKIVVFGAVLDIDLLAECFSNDISGFLLENISPIALEASLRLVCVGEKTFPSELAWLISDLPAKLSRLKNPKNLLWNGADLDLSSRDVDILLNLAEGKSNKQIGRSLSLAESTVKFHVKRILSKMQVSNRTQAAMWVANRKFEVVASGESERRGRGDSAAVTPGLQNGNRP